LCENIAPASIDFFSRKRILVLPYMASIVAKKKANQLYYYVVHSARVDGKPRIVQQTYLGTAERVAELVQDRTAPIPIAASSIEFGLPGSLWLAAQNSGAFAALESIWPAPRPVPPPPITCCWQPFTASASRVRKPRSPIGIAAPSSTTSGAFLPSDLLHKPFGIASIGFSSPTTRTPPMQPISCIRPNRNCCKYGSKSGWSAAACWPTTLPTFTPT
jgi:hypothetical protein